MKLHVKIYTEHFGIGEQDRPLCEIKAKGCQHFASDVHHIFPRGMGGSKSKDYIENLVGVCRECHNKCESGEISKAEQIKIHNRWISTMQ